ncbi:insulin-like growth factor-binding protein 3 receptor [Pyxicephalus adspersus]|uniref:TMEM248/TMEM219 domain-containing protein n=1 Tax=Pyxicephalus adspersus TaxID=30357 RepID=A0AAV3AB01_PYXAD|nr:TPA: hypothetical protein GDO54_014920 [Pyxicephalus adspersus]
MTCQPCQGLRSCIHHHPPVVTFFICVVTLGFTYLLFGAYIMTQPVQDIDFTQEWGGILHALSTGKICTQSNSSQHVEGTRNPEDSANASALVTITISPWQLVANHSSLKIIANGTQLGMKGTDTQLTITLISHWLSTQCNISEVECTAKYCISLTGPRELLPRSTQSIQCPLNSSSVPEIYMLETEPIASTKCYNLMYDGNLKENLIPQEEAALCAQRLRNAALVILALAFLWMVLLAFCSPSFKEKKTEGPL